MLYKNGVDLNDNLLNFIEKSNKLSIYVPYIKLPQLQYLIAKSTQVDSVIVRWEANDLILGSSDLEVYSFLKELNIKLYRNPRLHLKAFINNSQTAFICSANISQRALNFPETSNYNYELGIIVEHLSISDRLYFQTIEAESMLITEKTYEALRQRVDSQKEKNNTLNCDFGLKDLTQNFLISSLPMSYSIESLKRTYYSQTSDDELELNCALHDLAIFKIPFGLSDEEFTLQLKSAFFNSPFIRAFLENLDEQGEIYFGRAKDWIQKNCSDSPTPRKWEITNNIQILFRWIVELGDGLYTVDRPNYSERLKITRQ